MATSGSSNDKRNFQCVTVASVDVIKLPLRDILASRIQPKDLFPKIQLSSTLKLRPDQKKICFIPPPGVPDYNKFDVTLLYTLIRNLCSLPCPAQGWGNEPRTTDTQISDDIERLRLFRNNYYAHAESAVISDAVFKDVWRDLKLVFRRIQPKKGCSVDYEEELRNIERTTFTDEYFSTFRVLLEALVTLEKQTDDRDEPTVSIQGENEIMWGDTAHFEADVKKAESSCWSITWHRRRGNDIKRIDTSVEKYSGSTKRELVINSVCKEDEGEYQALLSFESKGIYYPSRNVIRLNVIGDSNIVQNRTSVMEATSALQCLRILQDEELFTQTDVIVMQFLCTQTECLDLHAKCVEYAEQQKALCYFEKPPVNGYKNAQFHVKGELSSYTKDYIQDVLETVAAILDCKEEDILLNGVRHSNSFLLSLSVKEVYMKKLLALNEQDRLRLVRLNIDYLIIDKETIYLERPKAAYLGLRTTQSFKERSPSTGVPLRNQVTSSPPGVFAPISAISDSSEPDDKQVDRQHAALHRTSSPHASKGIQEETEHERLPPGQDPGPLTGLSGANSNLIESLADVDGALKVTAHVDEELQNLRAMEQKTLSKTMEKKIINDPIWGSIKLDPLCMKIIDTPQFQRLRHIKQLGGCSFVFPGACHNKFEHSIGTAHLARMMGDELQKKHTKETITDQEILCLEVAGLCHDLGHGPFSHVFDQQFQNKCKGKKWTHEDLSIKMLDKVFETLERSVDLKELIGDKGEELIKDLIEPSRALRKEKPFLYEIISNEENKIDVDKWDYFSRDCHMLGLHHNFQCQRSIKRARIVENHISFPKSEYFNLFDMFYTRFTLHRRAYQHPVVKAVEMMIADAFLKADNYLTFLPVGNPGEDAGKENKKVYFKY